MTGVIQGRRQGETLAQYRGRLRRENNDRVDALGLKEETRCCGTARLRVQAFT